MAIGNGRLGRGELFQKKTIPSVVAENLTLRWRKTLGVREHSKKGPGQIKGIQLVCQGYRRRT